MREPPLVAIRIVGDSINAEIAAHPHVGEAFPHRVPAADAEHQQREDEGEGPAPADHEQSDRKDRGAPQRRRAFETARPARDHAPRGEAGDRSEEHTSELQSLMRISYAVFCLKKKKTTTNN